MDFYLSYLGNIIDGPFDQAEAEQAQVNLVNEIMTGKVPGFLDGDDFESRADALDQIEVVAVAIDDDEMSFA